MKKIYQLFPLCMLMLILIHFSSIAQTTNPVAVSDSMIVYTYGQDTTFFLNVLLNDYDPEAQAVQICDVQLPGSLSSPEYNDTAIFLGISSLADLTERVYRYRICRVNDPQAVSNWTQVYVNPQMNESSPLAHNDTIEGIIGYSYPVNVLANDVDPNGDSIFFIPNQSYVISDSSVLAGVGFLINQPNYYYRSYVISDSKDNYLESVDVGMVVIKVENNQWFDSLNINNVNARFNCFGNHFWDMTGKSQYIVPSGSGVSSIFSGAFWIGGMDTDNNLHMAGERYRQVGEDYWAGPISNVYDSLYDKNWFHVWKLNRDDIEYHLSHWWEAGYEALPDILSWPAHGDTSLNQSSDIAPFEDHNNNGIYEPLLGDAPIIKGDQALYFVFNDARNIHSETEGLPLGIEIHAMAYAYNMPEDSSLWSTTFLQYKVINKSDTVYSDMYGGFFIDTDLGAYYDDYVGSNVEGGYFYCYNGEAVDGNPGDPGVYGENPPAQAVLFLGGPNLANDNLDNPKFDMNGLQICDNSINGLNFGDSIVDNERLGLTNFMYFNNGGPSYLSDPTIAPEYNNLLRGIWKDNTHMLYGGNGHVSSGALGPECNFMFPFDSDTCNWGTDGVAPNGNLNTPGNYWTEPSAGNVPSDKRGIGSSGPFTFAPGQVETFDIAFVWARAYDGDPWSSAELLEQYCADIKNRFEYDEQLFSKVDQHPAKNKHLLVYPNPSSEFIHVNLSEAYRSCVIKIYNSHGRLMYSRKYNGVTHPEIDIRQMNPGLYFIRCTSDHDYQTGSFIKF